MHDLYVSRLQLYEGTSPASISLSKINTEGQYVYNMYQHIPVPQLNYSKVASGSSIHLISAHQNSAHHNCRYLNISRKGFYRVLSVSSLSSLS